jgi:radical SAM protein with 4Fe4S-binding SPASM domain
MGETCNINCYYCYEKRKPYARALALSPAILERFLSLCGERPLQAVLHGGEPLLIGRKRLAPLLALLRQHQPGVSLSMQTNGTLLSDRWLDFFAEHWPAVDIGVSLDGDDAGNAHRVDYRDRPTYARVVAGLGVLERRGWSAGLITVVTRLVLGRAAQVIAHARELPAVRVLKLSPCLDYNVVTKTYDTPNQRMISILNPAGTGRPGWATSPLEYSGFVVQAWHEWKRSGAYEQFLLEPAMSILRNVMGRTAYFSAFCDAKEPFMVTLYPDGRIGSSDELRIQDSLLGHVGGSASLEDMVAMRTNTALRASLEGLYAKCAGCSHRTWCRGGSLADRMRCAEAGADEQYCDHRKEIIDAVRASL